MKIIQKNWYLFVLLSFCFTQGVLPLTQRYFHTEDMGYEYQRGTYLIVLADPSLKTILTEEETGDFIKFKQTQGYDVKVVDYNIIGGTAELLKYYLINYYSIDPMLEYVLLIGDVDGSYPISSYIVSSYNQDDLDVTDYPFTFNNNINLLYPDFFIGRWSIRSQEDLRKIKFRSIQYTKMDFIDDASYLNNALLVAGNYSDTPPWPVTPVMTSKWLMDELNYFGYGSVDTAFFHLDNQVVDNPLITSTWNDGVGIINYRGWGDANGWHKPYFHRESIDGLYNGLRMPVVFSFVCNTGDFGSSLNKCFGEALITGGTTNNPKGAVAMVGPSDLDTDTRFNNIICAVMWDEMLEERIPELAPALHAGKQSLIKEFGDLEVNGTNIVEFYHHVYGVLGDPSLSVWLGEPTNMFYENFSFGKVDSSLVVSTILDENLMDVVGALLHDGRLIAKGISNVDGELEIFFPNKYAGSDMTLYLNKAQYLQEEIPLRIPISTEEITSELEYAIPSPVKQFRYEFVTMKGDWIAINELNSIYELDNIYIDSLDLTDDKIRERDIGFDFIYYGESYNKLSICSNGWVSFSSCLKAEGSHENNCSPLPYFFNNSITNPLGPYGMIAPFFDDLDDDGQSDSLSVYFITDSTGIAIVEWNNVANNQTNQNCPECEKVTFRLTLDATNRSESENGEIKFQYKEIYDIDDHGSTIGIESPDKNDGVEFLFNKNPDISYQLLQDSLVIIFKQKCDGPIGLNACDCDSNIYDCTYDVADESTWVSSCGGLAVIDECGVCNGNGLSCKLGCTYFYAENYDPDATISDGSCIILGCTDVYSDNHSASATQDDGSCNTMAIDKNLLPQNFSLNSYPNPFNPVVRVSFALPEMELASVRVFDIRGREMATLADQNFQPGYYSVNWDASPYSSGVYFITLMSSDAKLTQKVLLLK